MRQSEDSHRREIAELQDAILQAQATAETWRRQAAVTASMQSVWRQA